jgi:hypothetical protein
MPATNKIIEILGINNIAQSFRIFFNLRAIAIAFGSLAVLVQCGLNSVPIKVVNKIQYSGF